MSLRLVVAAVLACVIATVHAAEGSYAIVGATVHTGDGAPPIEGGVVLVSEGRVDSVGADLAVPAGYEVITAGGSIVTPGLIDSYSQLGIDEIPGEPTTVDSLVELYPAGPGFDVRYAVNEDSTELAVNRRDGVTRAVVAPLPGNDPLAGWGVAVRLTSTDPLVRTDLALFGALGYRVAPFTGGSRSAVVQRLRRGLTLARGYNPARYQPGPGDYSRQDMEGLKRFLDRDAPLVLLADRTVEIREALALAHDFDLKLIIRGGAEGWKVRDELARTATPVIINELENLPASFEQLGARLDNAALLNEAGVPLLLTGGETQNLRWLRQAGNAVANGLPWEAALAAMTGNPGRIWSLGAGTLAHGAAADLVIWNGDPFELTTWPERVMIDGAWQDLRSRQTRLFERYRDPSDPDVYYR